MKTDAAGGLFRRVHELADGFKEGGDVVIVALDATFQFDEFNGELAVRAEQFAQFDERAHDLNAGLDGDRAPIIVTWIGEIQME